MVKPSGHRTGNYLFPVTCFDAQIKALRPGDSSNLWKIAGGDIDGLIRAAGQIEVPAGVGESAQLTFDKFQGQAQGLQGVYAMDKCLVAKPGQLHFAAIVATGGFGVGLRCADGNFQGHLFALQAHGIEFGGDYGSLHLDIPSPVDGRPRLLALSWRPWAADGVTIDSRWSA